MDTEEVGCRHCAWGDIPMCDADRAIRAIRERNSTKPFVIAQLGQSLDGRIALPSGESKYINGPAALDHLHRLRAAVDAVIVGVGTILADDPQLTVRRTEGRSPARVIIDPNGRLTASHKCLERDGTPVIILRRPGIGAGKHDHARVIYLEGDEHGFQCRTIVRVLNQHGLQKLLIEGGAYTVSRFFDEGQIDRLHLLVGPVFLGQGPSGLNIKPPMRLAQALRIMPEIYPLEGGDVLFDCDLRRQI